MQLEQSVPFAAQKASKDPVIYNDMFRVLEMAHKIHGKGLIGNIEKLPGTVDKAVERLICELSLKGKMNIANMSEKELMTLQFTQGS